MSRSEIETKMRWEEVEQKWAEYRKIEDDQERIEQTSSLLAIAATPSQKVLILLRLVDDLVSFKSRHCISITAWKRCVHYMFLALDILEKYQNILVCRFIPHITDDTMRGEEFTGIIEVMADLADLVRKIDYEFFFSFEYIEPSTPQFEDRLKDEHILFSLCDNVLGYLIRLDDTDALAKVARTIMGQVYFKSTENYKAMQKYVIENTIHDDIDDDDNQPSYIHVPELVSRVPIYPRKCKTIMDSLFPYVRDYGKEKIIIEAHLYWVYQRAVTDDTSILNDTRWKGTLMDRIYHLEHVVKKYPSLCNYLKTSYCSTIAQVGLCAYRAGRLQEAGRYLSEIFSSEPGREDDQVVRIGENGREMSLDKKSWEEIFELPYYQYMDRNHLESVYYSTCETIEVIGEVTHRDA